MKALLLISLLFVAYFTHAQVRQHVFTLDMSGGDTTIEIKNIVGYIYGEWQISSIGFNAADATFALNKRNERPPFGAITGAAGTFVSGTSIRFIRFADPIMSSAMQLVITANSVTAGIIRVDINLFKP